jgi:hypothetical protein
MSNYQSLQKYKGSLYGSLEYGGMEYDFEVPDNQVISSPGGLSAVHHHPSKGLYSKESSSFDIYGGEPIAYPYGEFENLYQTGQAAPYYMEDFQQPIIPNYTKNPSLYRKDNFAPSIELIPLPDTPVVSTPEPKKESFTPLGDVVKVKNPWAIFILLLILWLAIAYWTYAIEGFVTTHFHGGKTLNWKWLAFYAVLFTITLAIAAHFSGVAISDIESG